MPVFTIKDSDRDSAGRIRLDQHTPLADLIGSSARPPQPAPASSTTTAAGRLDATTVAGAAVAALLLLLIVWYVLPAGTDRMTALSVVEPAAATAAPPRPTAAPPQPTAAPVEVAPAPLTLPRNTTAYDEPNGRVLGVVEGGRPYSVIGRYGAGWLLLEVAGSGGVSVNAAESGIAVNMAWRDYAPPPPPPAAPAAAPPVVYSPPAPPIPDRPIVLINPAAAPAGAQYSAGCGGPNPPLVCANAAP